MKCWVDAWFHLKLFVEANPGAPEAEAIKNKIYGLEVRIEEGSKLAEMRGGWKDKGSPAVFFLENQDDGHFELKGTNATYRVTGVLHEGRIEHGEVHIPRGVLKEPCDAPAETKPLLPGGIIDMENKRVAFSFVKSIWSYYRKSTWGTFSCGYVRPSGKSNRVDYELAPYTPK